ncbi:MAG: tetratricopeptide repeat protein [Nitrospirae bacterium]|nr:tetratricopeptide repeat protein [Nitrospirota bacterium]
MLIGLSVFLSVLVYVQTLSYEFVYDDIPFITEEPGIRDIKNIPGMFLKKEVLDEVRGGYYKPLLHISFAIDYYLWGLNPLGFHLSNIALHAIGVALVFFLSLRLLKGPIAAFVSSIFFGVHPVNTEAVTFLSARNTVLCAIFIVSAFLASMRYKEGRALRWLFISLLLFFFGLLSKEFAVMLPFVMLAGWFLEDKTQRQRFNVYIPYFVVLLIYLVLRSIALKGGTGIDMKIIEAPERIGGMLYAFASYIRLSFIPFEQKALYDISTVTSLKVIASAIVLLVAIWVIFKNKHRAWVGFPALWFLGFLVPVTNIVPLFGSFMAERYLYIPLIGAGIFIGGIFSALPERRIKAVAFTVFLLVLAMMSLLRNPVWRSDEALYSNMVKTTPTSYKGSYNLGNVMLRKGNLNEAKRLYLKTLEVKPDMMAVRNNLGVIYEKQENYKEAEKQYRAILDVRPIPDVFLNLGNALSKQGKVRLKEAEDAYKTAIGLSPKGFRLYVALTEFYERTERPALALEVMNSAIGNIPDPYRAYNIAGTVLGKIGRFKEARSYFVKALELNPECRECRYNMDVLSRLEKAQKK